MNIDERLSQILQEATSAAPPVSVDLDAVAARARHHRTRRVMAALGVVVLLAAAGVVANVVARGSGKPARLSTVTPPTADRLYTASALLLSVRGGPYTACGGVIAASLPPAGCGGVPLSGFDLADLPASTWTRAANGTVWTLPLVLVGRWDGERLTLTQPPTLAATSTSVEPPDCPAPTASGTALSDAISRDQALLAGHHIRPFGWGPCGNGVWLTVPVADPATVAYLTDRYPGVVVRGWLQPYTPTTSSSPATVTKTILYTPFTTAGGFDKSLTIVLSTTGTCQASDTSQRSDVYRCFLDQPIASGATIADPCFRNPTSSGALACPLGTSLTEAVTVTPNSPLAGHPGTNEPLTTLPWLLQLADGQRCLDQTGAQPTRNGQRRNYACPKGAIYGVPDRSTPDWTIDYQPGSPTSNSTAPIARAVVATAWF